MNLKSIIYKRQALYIAGIILVIIVTSLFLTGSSKESKNTAKAERTNFITEVEADGEIVAREYEAITVPEEMNNRELRIWFLKISDLVSEGTKVKKGDFIAKLDPTDVESRIKSIAEKIEDFSNSLETAKIDSAIALSEKRDAIINAADNLEENKITVEQSKFESKATQRQAAIGLKKAELALETAKRNYSKEIQKHKDKVLRYAKKLDEQNEIMTQLESLKKALYVTSPSEGMVVYGKSWRGNKIKVNDEVGRWQPIIATIPDLKTLESEAVVKEIDISKIRLNQKVNLSIDAFPKETFEGVITKIANIGQSISGTRMNGFTIRINITDLDSKILPGMTTYNKIQISNIDSALVVPREAIFGSDSVRYVYKKTATGIDKTTVITGGENETQIRILEGLQEGDKVLLEEPN